MAGDLSNPTFLAGRGGRFAGKPRLGPDGRACRSPTLRGGALECGPGDPEGENVCFKLVEFPGLLINKRVSMASCSLTFLCGEYIVWSRWL